MKKAEIARRIALESGVTRAEAADKLDRMVHRILTNLKRGHKTELPGLGAFLPDSRGARFEFEEAEPGGKNSHAERTS